MCNDLLGVNNTIKNVICSKSPLEVIYSSKLMFSAEKLVSSSLLLT